MSTMQDSKPELRGSEQIDRDTAIAVIKRTWIKKVRVDECWEFSDCPPECDDCFWMDYFDVHTTPYMEQIKAMCETFTVTSPKSGKEYTYYAPTDEAINYLLRYAKREIDEASNIN